MNDVPEPQLKPLSDGSGTTSRHAGSARTSMTPRLVLAAAVIVACSGGILWKTSSSSPPAPRPGIVGAGQPDPAPGLRPDATHLGAQLALVPTSQVKAALATTGFSSQQKTDILAAVKNRRMRLVRMPIAQIAGPVGQSVTITSGGMRQSLLLRPTLQSVVLPIYLAGEVMINPTTPPPVGGLETGILTALGPQLLPRFTSLDQQLVLDVIVQ
ncbi:hypothetical protein AA21291_0380 [Swaminathania salitolerans LMG 21291]|uniref:Uncharacterized protein n=2 Tax=Swaminathania salitolerans TaxID=182838 RepID=A0A511BLM2_9PROT|nr:hypothetical protein AA21291_0380 [Swaminathania salitolerans LMG 21291]GEL01239.1 hypothetical protein SSA02_04020 [Swaminathania salitolerans]